MERSKPVFDCITQAESEIPAVGWEAGRKPRRLRPLVAFSSGPYAAALADGSEYTGSYVERVTFEQMVDFHRKKLQVRAHPPLSCSDKCVGCGQPGHEDA